MEKLKLTKENIIMLFAGAALTFSLMNCSLNNNQNNTSEKQVEEITQYHEPENEATPIENNQEEIVNEQPETQELQSQDNDQIITNYLNDLKDGFNELKNYASDQWNSEEFQTKLEECKQRLRNLLDFVFNGKEINGITFNDLSSEAKTKVMNALIELDEWIETLFPEYKERIYGWLVSLGADGIELWNEMQDGFNNYSEDVMDEYNSRNTASYVKIK